MGIVVYVQVTASMIPAPGVKPGVNIKNFTFELAVSLRVLDSIPDLIDDLTDPVRLAVHRQDKLLPCSKKFIHVVLAVETSVQYKMQPGQLQIPEGLQEITQGADVTDVSWQPVEVDGNLAVLTE
jgi:hypothetical protein